MSLSTRAELFVEAEDIGKPESLALMALYQEQEAGRLIECLDDGFVRLVDVMGSDAAIVQAARVSYGAGTKTVNDDRGLIRYLLRHYHTTPLEMVEFKFHIRVPMDCWRQWIRHRTANVNETSTRYSEAIDSMQETDPGEWRLQAKNNKQGSAGVLEDWPPEVPREALDYVGCMTPGEWLTNREEEFHERAVEVYQERLALGVAREQARKDLPLANYTESYWKIDLHNLLHFLRLRMDTHAQLEIRTYANAMYELIKPIVPLACEAFEDYRLNAMALSAGEINAIRYLLHPDWTFAFKKMAKREFEELRPKLSLLGIDDARLADLASFCTAA